MKHLKENNETYFSHLLFASRIAVHLCLSGACLMVHGLLPFWAQPKSLSLSSTCKKIKAWNDHAEQRKRQ